MHDTRTFTVANPRDFDGNPFEVAERAVAQLEGLIAILAEAIPPAELMARNAEMTRRMDAGEEPEGDRWVETPQGRYWVRLATNVASLRAQLRVIKAAAGYDPRHPPKE